MRFALLLTAALAPITFAATVAQTPRPSPALQAAVAAPTRTPANRLRDQYRHPAETLAFFGIKPTDTVVELIPGGGWYTEILAPYLRQRGSLWVASGWERGLNGVKALQAKDAPTYAGVRLAAFPAKPGEPVVPAGSADVVVTFRNIHNLRFAGVDQTSAAFAEMYRMLRPGGTLGIVEHRLPEGRDASAEEKSGYMKVSSVIAFATAAGFRQVASSEVNANPRDTADWPEGVWTLPPTYRLGQVDRAKYAAIGESDRMTLRFVKPRR